MSKGCYYKPDGSLFVLAGANKMEGGANNGTLQYIHSHVQCSSEREAQNIESIKHKVLFCA